jgi:ATP-dependent DNA helicase RecQ
VEEAGARLARPGVVVEPRKMWPTALGNLGIDLKGKIAEPAGEGRAVARLTDLGHGSALRELFRSDAPDGPVPVGLVTAVIEVLGDWRPPVDGLVVVESVTRPTLTADLAEGLSRYLRVPVLGRWAVVDPDVRPGQGAANSAQRVAAVGRRFALHLDDGVDLAGMRVLVVDDLVVTGWTLTLAARSIRAAGAAEVRPLVLGTQS